MTKDEARNVPLTAEDGPITFRSKAHLIASVLGAGDRRIGAGHD